MPRATGAFQSALHFGIHGSGLLQQFTATEQFLDRPGTTDYKGKALIPRGQDDWREQMVGVVRAEFANRRSTRKEAEARVIRLTEEPSSRAMPVYQPQHLAIPQLGLAEPAIEALHIANHRADTISLGSCPGRLVKHCIHAAPPVIHANAERREKRFLFP
ncbi:hypothetical protein [Rhodococcus globerulus]|uniref:hypothetical protein n=1 Tax=Rhodococcus globerulus TaxID=33008 RepID=UPI003017E133